LPTVRISIWKPMLTNELPVFLLMLVTVLVALATLVVSHWIAPKRLNPVKQMPYESGMDPIKDARQRFDVRFYLLAIAFLVFDVELLLLYPWAVASGTVREAQAVAAADSAATAAHPQKASPFPDWTDNATLIFSEVMVFVVLLGVAYVYAWRRGVFAWR
jgi:NADH-quinone oxidoreductase subunit A